MTNAYFNELFAYNWHSNQQLSAFFLKKSTTIDTKSIDLFSHILNAHHIWNNRILGKSVKYRVWGRLPVEDFTVIDQRNYEETQTILETFDLAGEITYKTSDGRPFANTIRDILFHITNHSTYHRGQIALLCRQNGIEPLVSDYIFYKR